MVSVTSVRVEDLATTLEILRLDLGSDVTLLLSRVVMIIMILINIVLIIIVPDVVLMVIILVLMEAVNVVWIVHRNRSQSRHWCWKIWPKVILRRDGVV